MGQSIIRDHRVLGGMERAGFIIRNGGPKSRERHWSGASVPVITVEPGPKLRYSGDVFTYKGTQYRLKYFDGCFKPFVTRYGAVLPAFI